MGRNGAFGSRPGAGALLQLIRAEGAITRAELARRSGLGRAAVSQRLDELQALDLVRATGDLPSTGGRPPTRLAFNRDAGVVLAADLGATHARLAITDLEGGVLADSAADLDVTRGPDAVLEEVAAGLLELLGGSGRRPDEVRGVGVGVPGPVEFVTGRPVSPPIMPGWDGYSIPEHLQRHFPVPVLVDNDVNIMAVGEHRTEADLLLVKVGTGIGCGIVAGGKLYRGAQGAAGDIGHIRVVGHDDVICECGNIGCLEAVAGGRALARAARGLGLEARDSRDVVALARARHPEIGRLVRESGRMLGDVLSGLVNAFNPRVILIGGDLAEADEQLFAGVRETVYGRATPLATRRLQIARSALGDRAGTIGAAVLALEHVFDPVRVDALCGAVVPAAAVAGTASPMRPRRRRAGSPR
jgi:predicted NBD/HSP70 family sugar kinase